MVKDMKDKVLQLVEKNPVYAPVLLAIVEWEEENQGKHDSFSNREGYTDTCWKIEETDFQINPGHLGYLVNQGVLVKPFDSRNQTYFALSDRKNVKRAISEVRLPENFELKDTFYTGGRVNDAIQKFDRAPKNTGSQVKETPELVSTKLEKGERMGLDKLKLNSKDINFLDERGISSVEGLAIQDPGDLPFTKQRSERLIKDARQLLAFKEIEALEINQEKVELSLKKLDPIVERSLTSVFNFGDGCSKCHVDEDQKRISSIPREGLEASWENRVKLQAKKWEARFQDKQKTEEEKLGITLDLEEIREFAEINGFDGFWDTVFQNIKGNEVLKKALSVAMFSPPREPLHVAVIGPPASAKSQSMENIQENFTGIQSIGGNVTRAGLVMNYATGEPGALAAADGKLVLADEFDKVNDRDIQYVYELMSSGRCEVHTGGVHETIRSRFTLVAFMNPTEQTFSHNPISDIGLESTLISRFGLIIKAKELGETDRIDVIRKEFYGGEELKEQSEYFNQWVKLGRLHKPTIVASENQVENYLARGNDVIEEFQDTPLRRDMRMKDYLKRIPFAIARSEFKNVDKDCLNKAWEIIDESLDVWR